jgi:peptidoglycan/xylan/chitin deacetylase (PgdA/CDA1 family)
VKIIVSHDIDHITAWEHKNMTIPKHIARSTIELLSAKATLKEYGLRLQELLENKWNNLEEIMAFNQQENIPATFFVGMENGLGLDYGLDHARKWTRAIRGCGFDVGVHGIAYQDQNKMQHEYDSMKNILGLADFGIRMHYLRGDSNTQKQLEQCGYLFDSTLREDSDPYRLTSMYEFPLHLMDGDIMYPNNERWMTLGVNELKEATARRIHFLEQSKIQYMTFLFHDRYFGDAFSAWKEWYIWSINRFKKLGFEFISYKDAIRELNEKMA